MDFREKEQVLQQFIKDQSNIHIPQGMLQSEFAIRDMIDDHDNWQTTLHKVRDGLSLDQKILLASHFGGEFGERYNSDRTEAGNKAANGIVKIEDLLRSVKSDEVGGICRDVAFAQAQILSELGVSKDDIHIISYATAGGHHAVVTVKDPNEPNNLIKLNYNYVHESNGVSGPGALVQDNSIPDTGIAIKIYDSEGRPVTQISSEIGQVLQEVADGQTSPRFMRSYELQRVGIQTRFGSGSVFTGQTSIGERLVGVMLDKKINFPAGTMEVNVGYMQRSGERSQVIMNQQALYARLKNSFNTPERKIGNFTLQADIGAEQSFLLMKNRVQHRHDGHGSTVQESSNVDTSQTFFVGANISGQSSDGKTHVDSRLQMDTYLSTQHVAESASSSGYRLVNEKASWMTGVSHQVTDDMRLVGESAVVLRKIGNSASFTAGIEKSGTTITAGYQTPFGKRLPAFMPGSDRGVMGGVERRWKDDNVTFSMIYQRNLDNGSNNYRVQGGLKW